MEFNDGGHWKYGISSGEVAGRQAAVLDETISGLSL